MYVYILDYNICQAWLSVQWRKRAIGTRVVTSPRRHLNSELARAPRTTVFIANPPRQWPLY